MTERSLLYRNDRAGCYPDSYYAATAVGMVDRPRLSGVVEADVCIIGAGFAGLSAALHCAERGRSVVVLDAHRVGWGASGRNGGQAGAGQRVDQDELEPLLGLDDAREAFRIGIEAPKLVQELAARHSIPIGYKPGILHANHRARYDRHSRAYAHKLNEDYGYEQIRYVDRDELPEMLGAAGCFGGTLDMGGGHCHPLNLSLGLARAAEAAGARLYERSPVVEVDAGDPHVVRTDGLIADGSDRAPGEALPAQSGPSGGGTVRAGVVLYACNGYLAGLEPKTAARVMPINSFVVATQPLEEDVARGLIRDDVAVADSRFVVNYYRLSEDRRLLFGGGETYGYGFPARIDEFVRRPMMAVFPQLEGVRIDYGWGGTLGITMPRLPDFAELGQGVYSMSGYSGSGLAMATRSGKIFADMLDGDDRDFRIMQRMPTGPFPGGVRLRHPLLFAAMTWYAFRDRL